MAEILTKHGHCVGALHIQDPDELLGINTRVELADADRVLRERKCRDLMLAGVTIERPETVTIDTHVQVGTDTVVEPFARLLGSTEVGEECRIGAGSNIGAGTITCNYDGEQKHQTRIGERAFIGSNSTLVAPVEIGADSYVGAGSVITEPVPPEALALGRSRQVVKPDWVKGRKKQAAIERK